jgi:hypothetical protein
MIDAYIPDAPANPSQKLSVFSGLVTHDSPRANLSNEALLPRMA